MAFDDEPPPEPDDGPRCESDFAEWEAEAALAPDAVGLVVEVADVMATFAAERLIRIDRMRREALADAERHGLSMSEVVARSIRLELACALRITEHAAGELLGLAEAVVHRYPAVLESLSRARMTERHAEILVSAVDAVEPEFRDRILSEGVVLAETQPVGTFRRLLRKLVDTVRVTTLAQRHEHALQGRRVVVEPADDGMAWLMALIPAVEAHAIYGRATAIAKVLVKQPGEARALDQIRADVVCDLLIDGDTTLHPKKTRGIRATVVVTVPVLSLLDDELAAQADPAVVEGVGPIPLDRARELCGGAGEWMRVLTHPETGMVLSVSRTRYRPPASLRKLVRWRAARCLAPGCGMPASRCHIDHNIAWQQGGPTALSNLAPFCEGHHIVKHHGGWTIRQLPSGAIEWTSPTGRQYTVQPERVIPTFRTTTTKEDASAPF